MGFDNSRGSPPFAQERQTYGHRHYYVGTHDFTPVWAVLALQAAFAVAQRGTPPMQKPPCQPNAQTVASCTALICVRGARRTLN